MKKLLLSLILLSNAGLMQTNLQASCGDSCSSDFDCPSNVWGCTSCVSGSCINDSRVTKHSSVQQNQNQKNVNSKQIQRKNSYGVK